MFERARVRLALWYAAAFAVILVVIAVAAYAVMARELDREIDRSLETAVTNLAHAPAFGLDGDGATGPRPPREAIRGLPTDVFYFVIGPLGSLVQNPRDFDVESLPLERLRAQGSGSQAFHEFHAAGEHYRVASFGVQGPNGNDFTLVAGRSMEARDYQLRLLAVVLGLGGLGGLALAAVGGFWLAGRALVPIRQSLETQRRFVSDASHELRTPVAVMKANAELLLRHPDETIEANIDQVAAISEETDHLSQLVGDLLTLARADEQRLEVVREQVNLDELFDGVARDMAAIADAKDVELTTDFAAGIIAGDSQRLRQLAAILVDNAIKFTPSGGVVRLSSRRSGSRVVFSVADSGPGIAPHHLPHVFDRFYRGDAARTSQSGTGLGLAIARSIADAHGGRISAEQGAPSGAVFTVRLPLRQ